MAKTKGSLRKFWIGVASLEHVHAAVKGGFCQLSHGKEAPVKRLQKGDVLVFYSPKESMRGNSSVQAFSAAGLILDEYPHQVEQAPSFRPFRRKVHYLKSKQAPIQPLLEELSFTKERSNWGFAFRRGAFAIDEKDFLIIASAMSLHFKVGSES